MVKSFDLSEKKNSTGKRHTKRELPKKYRNATPGAKEVYGAGISGNSLAKIARRRGVYQIGAKAIDASAERIATFARALVLDAVRNAKYCGKKTVNQEHAREALRTSRTRLGLPETQLAGI